MLDKHDIALLEGMLDNKLKEQLDKQDQRFDIKLENLKVDMRDEMHSSMSASDTRMIARMDMMEKRIISGVTDFIDAVILPQLDKLDHRVTRLENHPKLA